MTTTPPIQRVHTPPTPLLGPMMDSYEPYSPRRRSSRIHNKHSPTPKGAMAHPTSPTSLPKHRGICSASFRRTSSQTFSPPSSPASPATNSPKSRVPEPHQNMEPGESDGDFSYASKPSQFRMNKARGTGNLAVLPTPTKTPRKRERNPEDAQIASAARVLFPNKAVELEDNLPTPPKTRKSKRHEALTLESFAEACEEEKNFEIFTDIKERVPGTDEDKDNPFIVNDKAAEPKAKIDSEMSRGRGRKTKHGMSKEIDDAVDNGEGMVYVFRGKKLYVPFTGKEGVKARPETNSDPYDLRRQAGVTAQRPLRGTKLKPRLLFRTKSAKEVDEEEALTDIEAQPLTDPAVFQSNAEDSPKVVANEEANQIHEASQSQESQDVQPESPVPEDVRDDSHNPNEGCSDDPAHELTAISKSSRSEDSTKRAKKSNPFGSWQRTKAGLSKQGIRSVSMKRQGSPLQRDEVARGKRSRSAMGT